MISLGKSRIADKYINRDWQLVAAETTGGGRSGQWVGLLKYFQQKSKT